jgi:hypothetical protein
MYVRHWVKPCLTQCLLFSQNSIAPLPLYSLFFPTYPFPFDGQFYCGLLTFSVGPDCCCDCNREIRAAGETSCRLGAMMWMLLFLIVVDLLFWISALATIHVSILISYSFSRFVFLYNPSSQAARRFSIYYFLLFCFILLVIWLYSPNLTTTPQSVVTATNTRTHCFCCDLVYIFFLR